MSSPRSTEENKTQDEQLEIIFDTETVYLDESQFVHFEYKEDKDRYAVELVNSDEYFDFKKSISREDQSEFTFPKNKFKCQLVSDSVDVLIDDSKKIPLDHPFLINALWIEELNQLITLSIKELKVWLFENEIFQCVMSCKTGLKDQNTETNLQVSSDNRLIVVTFKNNLFLFDLITKQNILYQHIKEEKEIMRLGLDIPVIVSSSQIAFNCSNMIYLYDVDFKHKRIKEKECIKLPHSIMSFKFLSNGNDIIFVSHSNVDYLRIYHRDTKTLSNLYELHSPFMELNCSSDESQLKLQYENKYLQLRLIDLYYKKKRDKLLTDSLLIFSLDIIRVLMQYCDTNNTYRLPDARTLTRLPLDLRLEFQLGLSSCEDSLLMLFFLIANSTKSLEQSVKEVKDKYPKVDTGWFNSTATLFKKIRKIAALEGANPVIFKRQKQL